MPSNDDRTCSLQINLHPSDAAHARHTLPHQLRVLAPQVDEVVLSLDLRRAVSNRYRTDDYEAKREELEHVLGRACAGEPKARLVLVEETAQASSAIAEAFLGGTRPPTTAGDGSPFFAYLHGLHASSSRYVMHLDSDMLLGGGSTSWVQEAVTALVDDPRLLACNPLGGPPSRHGKFRDANAVPAGGRGTAYLLPTLSTRVFLLDLARFRSGELQIPLVRPRFKRRVDSIVNYTPAVVPFEECVSTLMRRHGLVRLDLLGSSPGLWSLHPPHRSDRFYRELPTLIERVESGDVPEGQEGEYDVNDALLDWSDVRRARTPASRLRRRLQWAAAGLAHRAATRRRTTS